MQRNRANRTQEAKECIYIAWVTVYEYYELLFCRDTKRFLKHQDKYENLMVTQRIFKNTFRMLDPKKAYA